MSPTNAGERGARVRFPPPLVFLGFTLLGVGAPSLVGPLVFPGVRAVGLVIGLLLIATGIGFAVRARIHFVRTGQNPAPWKPSPELIQEGPYRFTRNPMYLGITLLQLGLGWALNNLWISVFALPALLTVHFIAVRPEERYLTEKFGESYRAYQSRVRRYL